MGWNNIVRNIGKMDLIIKIGLFGEGSSPKNNLAARGAVHHFGAPKAGIPSRPFMSQAFDNGDQKLKKFITTQYKGVIDGKISAKTMMDDIGIFHTNQIQDTIRNGNFVALKEETKRRKGSSKPLIDKAIMINSVKHVIKK